MDFEDLLGGSPDGDHQPITPAPEGRDFNAFKIANVHDIDRGVTINWLAQAFTIPRKQVESKLSQCPVLRAAANGTKVYDFRDAVPFLVKPRIDLRRYLNSLEPKDLPEQLRSEFWSARLKEQKARLNARQLWRDEDVQEAFGAIFKLIKDTVQLWTDSIDETTGITDDQREVLDELARNLLAEIGNTIEGYCRAEKVRSQIAEFDDGDDL